MGKISRTEENLFPLPKGAFLRNKSYVYVNTSNRYVPPSEKQEKGTRGYTGHTSVCIGSIQDPNDKNCKKFYANQTYLELYLAHELPDPPRIADSVAVGLTCWIAKASEQSGLTSLLVESFGEADTALILDLAAYMLSRESAVMQHFPAWARDHVIFSDEIRDDTYIGEFLRSHLTIPKIQAFREKWMVKNIGDGFVFLCYDSTNVNSQAQGVMIVQKGHAKDDPTLPQVNTDYVVRQSDGLPLTYLHSPGSVTDIAQAQEMIQFMDQMKQLSGASCHMCMVCDRGYISEKNLRQFDTAKIHYLLMLRTNFGLYDSLAEQVIREIRSYKYELSTLDGDEKYGLTKECCIYSDGPTCYAQIIWSAARYRNGRKDVTKCIDRERKKLEDFIAHSTGKSLDPDDLGWIPSYFKIQSVPGEPKTVAQKERGGTITVEKQTIRITGYTDDEEAINYMYIKSGLMILISREKMTAQEALDAYSKRDCVEKVFEALKSHMGMDKIGVTTEEAMHGKGLIWFVASILHALLFNSTQKLRVTDRKHYTVPSMIDQLEAIKADKNLRTGIYTRRYKITRRQRDILQCSKIDEKFVDEKIGSLCQ